MRPVEEIERELVDAKVALMYVMCGSFYQRMDADARIQELRQELARAKKEAADAK